MQSGGPRDRLEARLRQQPRERSLVAADVDAQAVRGTGEELTQLTGGDLMAAIQDDDVLADRLHVREEVARMGHDAAGRHFELHHESEYLLQAVWNKAGRGSLSEST